MARLSLILPIRPGSSPSADQVDRYRRGLEELGHSVEVVVSTDPDGEGDSGGGPDVRPGRAMLSVAGIREARGHLLIILDPERDYTLEDVSRVISPLIRSEADLAVATRWTLRGVRGVHGLVGFGAGVLTRPLLGTTDPWSGLIALKRSLARDADESFSPVGSRFTLELLARTGGRRVDVAVPSGEPLRRERLELDDFRHIKRLADDRFGNYSRLIQFCAVGASGMVVDLSSYALFQLLFRRTWLAGVTVPVFRQSLSLAAAGALAIALALVWNFALNRRLTFNDALRGSIGRQFLTYALGNALGIALSFSMRLILPRHFAFFHDHRLAAAVVGIVAATGISFSMSRWVVFGRRKARPERVRRHAESPSALAESLPSS
jgi:dolichol-phosphate mannosyltransferase